MANFNWASLGNPKSIKFLSLQFSVPLPTRSVHDPGLPYEQEASGGSGDNPIKEAKEQDRGVLDAPDEAHLEGPHAWHLPHALGGGARVPHGLRPRCLRHQHRPHRGRQGNPRHAPLPRYQ